MKFWDSGLDKSKKNESNEKKLFNLLKDTTF